MKLDDLFKFWMHPRLVLHCLFSCASEEVKIISFCIFSPMENLWIIILTHRSVSGVATIFIKKTAEGNWEELYIPFR